MRGTAKTVQLRFRVSRTLYEYLTYLSRHRLLGAAEPDVAEHVLTRPLEDRLHRCGAVDFYRNILVRTGKS